MGNDRLSIKAEEKLKDTFVDGSTACSILYAVAFFVVVLLLGQHNSILAENVPDSSTGTRQDIYAQVTQPNDPHGLLINLKYIVTHDLLLREDFHTDENYKKFFGAKNIKIGKGPGRNVWSSAYHFGYLGNIPPTTQIELSNSQISAGFKPNENDTMKGEISFGFIDERGPTFKEVEEVFGKKWEKDNSIQSPFIPFKAPTGPYGNYWIFYHFDDAGIKRTVHVIFGPDGRLKDIQITLEVR